MNRVVAVILRLLIAIAVALVPLTLWQTALRGSLADGFAEAARLLFLFMDIGLGVWLVLLVVGAMRGWGTRRLFLAAVIGVVVNLATVTVVGLVQGGTVPWEFMLWAIEAGIAFLVGAAVALAVVKPHRPEATPA